MATAVPDGAAVRITVKQCDEDGDGGAVRTGFSMVVRRALTSPDAAAEFQAWQARVRSKFSLRPDQAIVIVDDAGEVIESLAQLHDTQQLRLILLDDDSDDDENLAAELGDAIGDDVVNGDSSGDEDEQVVQHRFCLFPDLIKTHKGKQHSRHWLHELVSVGATFSMVSSTAPVSSSSPSAMVDLTSPLIPSSRFRMRLSIIPNDVAETDCTVALDAITNRTWVVLLCHGGFVAGAVLVGGVLVAHKTLHRYVQRKSQGKRQSSHDKSGSASGHASVGSQIRRKQEAALQVSLRALLSTWASFIAKASLIFVHAPGLNRTKIFYEGGPLTPTDPRVRSVAISTGRATLREALRVARSLATVQVIQQNSGC
ncbi:VLRF1/Vms1 domain-containing protein [Plasmodiophora brassicae]